MTTLSGFGDRLQARREVRRLADDAALLRLPRPEKIADDDHPGGDPDPHLQRRAGGGFELRRGFDDGEPGLHGSLGVMLVGLGIAEIGEHAVAHVFGDEAAVALDQRRAAAMIGADDRRACPRDRAAPTALSSRRDRRTSP